MMNEDDYPDYTISLVNFRYGDGSVEKSDTPYIKWSKCWAIPGNEGEEWDTLADLIEHHANVRVLKPGAIEWEHVSD